jgi:hypothetical protein
MAKATTRAAGVAMVLIGVGLLVERIAESVWR